MGFSISWLAFSGKTRDAVLGAMDVFDTDIHEEAQHSPMLAASFPGGWTVVWLNRLDHPFVEDASLAYLSKDCTLIAGHVEEHVMFSAARLFAYGEHVWSVFHESENGLYDIQVEGTPPAVFDRIRDTCIAQQDAEGGEDADVDHVFDIPLELAKALCGFEHCRARYDWGEPRFTVIRDRSEMQ